MPCPQCDDTGWKPVEDPSTGVRRVSPCECRLEQGAQKRLGAADIPPRYKHCTANNFDVYNDSLKRALDYARRLIDNFPINEKGVLFVGQPGVGKTHLAVAVLKEAISKGATGLFFTDSQLTALLRSTYTDSGELTESQVLKAVTSTDVLVLDELGRGKMTEWRDEMLTLVINTRYNQNRMTILTTNYDVGDINDPESLQCRVGVRVYSRLNEMCEILHLDAADYRERPLNASHDDLRAMWKMRKKNLPLRAGRQARAQLRDPAVRDGRADLKWPGGRAGS
jgi:DNA replication protein DnaC